MTPFEDELDEKERKKKLNDLYGKFGSMQNQEVKFGKAYVFVCSSCQGKITYKAAILDDLTRLEVTIGHEGPCQVNRPEGL